VANPSLLILAGDGIGPEVMAEVKKIIAWMGASAASPFDVSEDLVGGCAYDAHGTPLTDETMAKAQAVDAVLLGAVGGPKYDNLDFSVKPERGLLRLRKEMDLYANLRPAQCFDALADFSSLKKDVVAGLDIMIIRELTSGVYFGEPRGIFTEGNERVGINTQRYTESEIARVARSAFELARKRGNKVCSMEKANVMESGVLWRQVVQEVHDREYPDVELSHMYADAGAMQLTRWPKQFDVIVTDNLFGDLLSDLAAMLTGSLGMLPSASLGAPMANGRPKALYEPVHGSAPDIAGQGKANPIACILSFAMALRYSFDLGDEATRVEQAVEKVLADGLRTADLMGPEGGTPSAPKAWAMPSWRRWTRLTPASQQHGAAVPVGSGAHQIGQPFHLVRPAFVPHGGGQCRTGASQRGCRADHGDAVRLARPRQQP
jgi:3-isopropylmalate dehydrogenase